MPRVLKTARAHAAYANRKSITDQDIALAIRLAIPHRLKRGPFTDATADLESVESRLEQKREEMAGEDEGEGEASEVPGSEQQGENSDKKKARR